MSDERQANWIGGRWAPSAGAGVFRLRAATEPHEELGTWPRSDVPDAESALATARAPGVEPSALLGVIAEALAALRGDRKALEGVARATGLDVREVERRAPTLPAARALRDGIRAPGSKDRSEPGLAPVASHWSELFTGPLLGVARAWSRGEAALLVGDPRLPAASEAVARAFGALDLPPGSVALLQGVSEAGLERLLVDPRLVAVEASGEAPGIRFLRRTLDAAGRVPATQRLRTLRNEAVEVGPREDPVAAAAKVLEQWIDRERTLSGQGGGHVGRVFCHERVFSAFTEALLLKLERAPEPLPLIDRAAAESMRRVCRTAQDEGATWIAGGEDRRTSGRGPRPTIFTNVEPHMRLLRARAPMPVLALVRTGDPAGRGGSVC